MTRFIAAVESGAVDGFVSLLTNDVTAMSDGGGRVPPGFAITRSVHGREAVAKLFASFARRAVVPVHMEQHAVNGGPGVVIIADLPVGGGLIAVMSLDVREERIAAIHGVINPEKLRHLVPIFGALADFDAVGRSELPQRSPRPLPGDTRVERS